MNLRAGRDVLAGILKGLGAEVIALGRADHFIPVDTEAVDPETRERIAGWVKSDALDALVSTDGDSDRPLLADETGQIVPGDILGQITAEALKARAVVTPISSNSGVTKKDCFDTVSRTRIGSPYVIAGMEDIGGRVVGYEANGGFLLGFEADGPAGKLRPLKTRDCVLPILSVLHAARLAGSVSARVAKEPPVVTRADRLQEVAQSKSSELLGRLTNDQDARAAFLRNLNLTEEARDLTDGLRITLTDSSVLHIRPSGNAPELRLYVESKDAVAAERLLSGAMELIASEIAKPGP